MQSRPFIFVGSSSEGLPIAKAMQAGLAGFADVTLWTQGIFEPSFSYLESLTKALDTADFAVLVLTKDDVLLTRGVQADSPRDNVIFELGLFIGRLGRYRCFFIFERSDPPKLPSDLLGIAGAPYDKRTDTNFVAALGPACLAIEGRVKDFGLRTRMLKFTAEELHSGGSVPNLTGKWVGYSPDGPTPDVANSTLSIEQRGSFVRATVVRTARVGERRFDYEGRFSSGQLVLFFEEDIGRGYIVGTVVLHLSPNLRALSGLATYFAHSKGTVISTAHIYKRSDA